MNDFADTGQRLAAIERRDRGADGAFVFGPRTTRIYCRPSCPARRPRPDRIALFATPADAEAAGFRACLRCRPAEVASEAALVARVAAAIDARLDDGLPTLAALASALDVAPADLARVFRRATGVTPRQFAQQRRLDRLKQGLRAHAGVTAAILDAGFGSASRVYERDLLGMTPGGYRRRGHGMSIAYTIADGPLGRTLVAATERGVCAITFGDNDGELEAALRGEYPAASAHRDDAAMRPWLDAVLQHASERAPAAALPLDVRATAFQRRVWDALRAIPFGETRTYADVAEQMGLARSAARAVGRACAANPVSMVVPCHRVVRSDGELAGYRWGIERKRRLLEMERERG